MKRNNFCMCEVFGSENTIRILSEGGYVNMNGMKVTIVVSLKSVVDARAFRRTDEVELSEISVSESFHTCMEVYDETAFADAKALLHSGAGRPVC